MEKLIENLDLEEMDYYYHITSKGFGMDIIENGLYMEENDLRSTTIMLNEEFFKDPEGYCKREYKDGHVKRQEMVLIGCYKDEEESLVEKSDIPKFVGAQKLSYLIRSENILGYIDLETLNVIYNPEYAHGYMI